MDIIKIGGIRIQMQTLESAVKKAHLLGWASGAQYCIAESGVKWLKLVIAPEDVPYNPERFTFGYLDQYFGETKFMGFEHLSVVLPDGSWSPIWGMTYRATHFLEEQEGIREMYAFLRMALMEDTPHSVPFSPRGPNHVQDGKFQYRCGLSLPHHTILEFDGDEQIVRERSMVYELEFYGGTIC